MGATPGRGIRSPYRDGFALLRNPVAEPAAKRCLGLRSTFQEELAASAAPAKGRDRAWAAWAFGSRRWGVRMTGTIGSRATRLSI